MAFIELLTHKKRILPMPCYNNICCSFFIIILNIKTDIIIIKFMLSVIV